MSELEKLQNNFKSDSTQLNETLVKSYLNAKIRLQENCKHVNTHWIQEITLDGTLKEELIKRCYNCGLNITVFHASPSFIQSLIKLFDAEVEKEITKSSKSQEEKEKN